MILLAYEVLKFVAGWKMFKKMGRKGWEYVVPGYSTFVLFEEIYGSGWKMFLLLVPFYNIYVLIKFIIDLGRGFNKETGFIVGLIFLPEIFEIFLGLTDCVWLDNSKANTEEDFIDRMFHKEKGPEPVIVPRPVREVKKVEFSGKACPNCGAPLVEGSSFCTKCGTKVN